MTAEPRAHGSARVRVGISPFATTRSGAVRIVATAIAGGIDTLWLGDGLLEVPDFPRWSGGLEPFVELAWLGAPHPGARLGVAAAVLPLRDPLWLAKQAASLAHVSGGDVVLGVAPGYWEREFVFRGLDFAARGARFDDELGALRAALDGTEHHGEVRSVPGDARVSPIAPPGSVSVWLAGERATFERALRHGLPFQASRTPPDRLAPLAREWFDRGGGLLAARVRVSVTDEAIGGGAVEWDAIRGDGEHIAEQLAAFADLGVTDISLVPGQDDESSLQTVEALVGSALPALRSDPRFGSQPATAVP